MWALIPVKPFSGAKQRLSPTLSASQRYRLARAMACDVISRVRASGHLDGVLVVSSDPEVENLAINSGCHYLQEQDGLGLDGLNCLGLNAAVAQGVVWLRARKVDSAVIIHSDLPLLKTADLDGLLDEYESRSAITVVPDRIGLGSNLMVCPLTPSTEGFRFQYGVNSLQSHRQEANRVDIPFLVKTYPGIQFDVDNPQDLETLLTEDLLPEGSSTLQCLRQMPAIRRTTPVSETLNRPVAESQMVSAHG